MPVLNVRMFKPLMQQRVTIAPCTGYDNHGQAQYGAAVPYECAVVGEMKLVRNAAGEQVPSAQQVYLMSPAAVRPNDLVTLSTEDAGSTEQAAISPPIVAVKRYPFMAGQFFTEVDL